MMPSKWTACSWESDVPCSTINNLQLAENNPHYIAREVFTEWDDPQYGKVKASM